MITGNVLTGGVTNSVQTSYTTASVSPSANKLILLFLAVEPNTAFNPNPTVTGCGLTWVKAANTTSTTSGTQNCLIYRAMGAAPTAGPITITDSAYIRALWTVMEFSGVDTTGTNGSGAIVQAAFSNTLTGQSSVSTTFGTTITAGNSTTGILSVNSGSQVVTPGTGYVAEDTETIGITQQQTTLFASSAQQTVSATFSGTVGTCIAGVELKAAAASSIGESLLTSGNSSTDGTTFTTASITPTANAQIFAAVMTQPSGTPSNPVVSGCNLTWTQVAQQPQGSGNFQRTITVWRGVGAAPTTGALTITDSATDTQVCWSVTQLTNLDPTTPVTQVASGQLASVTNGSLSFGSQVDPSDATLAWIGYSNAGTLTAGTGWTSIDQQQTTASPQTMMTEYAATPQTSIAATLPASGNMFIVGIEANLAGSPLSTHTFEYGSFDVNLRFGASQASQALSGSVEVWGLTQQTPVPNAPTIGVATAGIQAATVGFTPASTGPSATSYTAVSSPGGITATGTSSPIGVAGLTAGQVYTFTVFATNATGNSANSASSNSVTPTAPVTGATLFGVSSTTVSEQSTNYPIFGPSPVCWRIYNTTQSGAISNPAITFRTGDSMAFSTTPYNSPGPTVSVLKTWFNNQPVGRRILYIPFHEPEDNIAAGTLTLANYLALFPTAMTAKQECSHPQDISICVVLQGETFHSNTRNPETYIPDDTNFDLLGADPYFQGNIGAPASTIPTAFDAQISVAKAHGKPWGIFETGVGTNNITEQDRDNALQTLSKTIADKGAVSGCYFVGKSNNEWVLTTSEASFWKAGQSG